MSTAGNEERARIESTVAKLLALADEYAKAATPDCVSERNVLSQALAIALDRAALPEQAPIPELVAWRAARGEHVAATATYNSAVVRMRERERVEGFGVPRVDAEFQAMTETSNRAHRLIGPLLAALETQTPPLPEQAGGALTEAYAAVGRTMVEMTTTVRGQDEWAAIPELWRMCMVERDHLRALTTARDARDAALLDGIRNALTFDGYGFWLPEWCLDDREWAIDPTQAVKPTLDEFRSLLDAAIAKAAT